MFNQKNSKYENKLKIKELAQIATEKINENKILLDTLSLYRQTIENIKSIMNKKNKNENSELKTTTNSIEIKNDNEESKNNDSLKGEFISYHNEIQKSVETLREFNKKLFQKYKLNNDKVFEDSSLQKIDLQKYRTDNFILFYNIRPKNDIIKKLNENILNSRRHSVFKELKRESFINTGNSENYLNNDNLYMQRDLQLECKSFNKCINRMMKKNKKLKKNKIKKDYLRQIIDYFQKEEKIMLKDKEYSIFKKKKENDKNNIISFSTNKKKIANNKRKNNMNNNMFNSMTEDKFRQNYQFEEDLSGLEGYNDDQTYMANKGSINSLFFQNEENNKEKPKEKKIKKKFDFQTVDELFDLENDEGEKEVIIQDELHSDDEVVFEKKIKNKVRVCTNYLSQIKKQVPNLYLNQIEFNKRKIINDADLYSYQRRKYAINNIDENIKLMRRRIKKLKKRIANNKEKLEAFKEFDEKAKEKYKILKPLKMISSLKDYNISFMRKEFYNFRNKKNDIIAEVDEKKYENEEKNDENSEEEGDADDYSDEMRRRNKNKYNNNVAATEAYDEEDNKYYYGNLDNYENNKPKSK